MDEVDRILEPDASSQCDRCGKVFQAADRATAWAIAASHRRTCTGGNKHLKA